MRDYFSLRVNAQLKEDFYTFCKSKGFTAGKAVKLLAKQFSKRGTLPFSLDSDRAYDEENLLRNGTRISIHMDGETRRDFSNACEEYGLPMSIVVRGFMDYCVSNNCFPYDAEEKRDEGEE